MEFKVGDRVRVIEKGFEGTIEEVIRGEIHNHYDNSGEYYYLYRVSSDDKFYNAIEEDMLELIEKSKNPTTLEKLEQRIEKLEKEVFKPLTIKDSIQKSLEENLKISLKPSLLTEDERIILRNLDKKWKWIARDSDGQLWIFIEKPHKQHDTYWSDKISYMDLCLFNQLFNFIRFGNDEPYNIEELLKGDCGNE